MSDDDLSGVWAFRVLIVLLIVVVALFWRG